MATQRPGIVVVTKFCKSTSNTFSNYINYINRNEATRNENSGKYSLYQDYMDNSEKTTGLFTANSFDLSESEKKQLKEVYQAAQENGSLMWQTVISFDNDWLKKNNMYVNDVLDEERLKSISKTAINKMLEKENLSNAVWSAAIHYNTDNIHIHIATVEPEPMREQKEYTQYKYKDVNGKKVKQPVIDAAGNLITRKEFKGKFKQSSLEACKSEIVNQIINQRENNLKINSIIRDSIVAQKKQHVLSKDKDLCKMFSELYQNMPEVGRNLWNYNNPVMYSLRDDIDALSTRYLEKYHSKEFEEFKKMILEQADKYREAYGGESDYAATKMNDLYTRLGNTILKEIREYDRQQENYASNNNTKTHSHTQQTNTHNPIRQHRKESLNLASIGNCIKKLKKGLKSEFEKSRLDRVHDQMVEQGLSD